MIPNRKHNIYPRTQENISAILKCYFNGLAQGGVEKMLEQVDLEVNQLEFIARKVKQNIGYFQNSLHPKSLTMANLMQYGIDALAKQESEWHGSKNRTAITKGFKELVLDQIQLL